MVCEATLDVEKDILTIQAVPAQEGVPVLTKRWLEGDVLLQSIESGGKESKRKFIRVA